MQQQIAITKFVCTIKAIRSDENSKVPDGIPSFQEKRRVFDHFTAHQNRPTFCDDGAVARLMEYNHNAR
jgi:hypothetical protein